MEFRDRDGEPLIKWHDPETAFEAWKACSRGRPCDYTALTYDRLRSESGIQWGGERLYTDGVFSTDPDYCEEYGRDLRTGATNSEAEYRAKEPGGRAFLHAALLRGVTGDRPATSTRCSSRRAARSTTSTRGPRPVVHRS